MAVMITGSAGFIASHFINKLKKEKVDYFGYDLPECNITNVSQLKNNIEAADAVIHFAAMADVTKCLTEIDETFHTNIYGTYLIAKLCAEQRRRLIFISTCCVYGNSLDTKEIEFKTAPMACEPYAVSKVAGEAIIRGMPYLDWSILRIGTVYGDGMRPALFTHIVFDKLIKNEVIKIDGDGKQTRQLIYIDDLIDGIYAAYKKFTPGSMFNLCGKEKISALGTMYTAADIAQIKPRFEHRAQRYGQTYDENIMIDNAKEYLGWEPKVSFKDGMKLTYEKMFK